HLIVGSQGVDAERVAIGPLRILAGGIRNGLALPGQQFVESAVLPVPEFLHQESGPVAGRMLVAQSVRIAFSRARGGPDVPRLRHDELVLRSLQLPVVAEGGEISALLLI